MSLSVSCFDLRRLGRCLLASLPALLLLALPINLTSGLQPQASGGAKILDGEYRRLD